MANLKPVYATESTILSTALDSLANGSAVASSEQDNSTNRYLDMRVDLSFAASAANTGYVPIYLQEGSATGLTSTSSNRSNMRYLGSIQMNGTNTVRKSLFVENLPKFWNLRVVNDSGGSFFSSSNTVKFTGINYENV